MNIVIFLLIFAYAIPCYCSPPVPKHTFLHRIKEDGYVTTKVNGSKVRIDKRKVFTSLIVSGYCFRRKDIFGKRSEIGSKLR